MQDISWGRKNFQKFFKIYFIRNNMKKNNNYLIIKVLPDNTTASLGRIYLLSCLQSDARTQ